MAKHMVPLTHGETIGGTATPEYSAWKSMFARCLNPKNPRFPAYGGRGITICDRWRAGFSAFLEDMGRKPSSRHSLDRVDNELGYTPENCRWALPHEQMTNRSMTRFVEVGGENIPLATLAKEHGIPANTLRFRILKGWPLHEALTRPVRPKAR